MTDTAVMYIMTTQTWIILYYLTLLYFKVHQLIKNIYICTMQIHFNGAFAFSLNDSCNAGKA